MQGAATFINPQTFNGIQGDSLGDSKVSRDPHDLDHNSLWDPGDMLFLHTQLSSESL